MDEGIQRWEAIPQEAGQRQTSHSPLRGVHPTGGAVRLGGAVRPCGRLQSFWEELQTIGADKARVVPAGWRHSSYRCCIASLAPAALPQGHQPEGRGSVGAALARPESARLLPLRLSKKSGL